MPMAPRRVVALSFRHALLPATLCRDRFRRSSVGPKIEGNFQEMILVVHFLTHKQETHKWHHVCASRVSSLFCEIKDCLQGKQNTSNLFSSRVGKTLMSLATARRAVHAAMEVISEVLDLVSPLNSSSPRFRKPHKIGED